MVQAASTSITSVLYLKDDVSIATSGAADKYAIFPSFHYAIIIMIQLLIAPKYVWIFIFHSSKYLPVL
jgi:hypothetical protein